MQRDTRANLWFLIVFLAISLPGAVILFRKKLDPSASRMDTPDFSLTQLPYMTPPPAPPGVKWIVPAATFAWLKDLAKQKTGSDQMLSALAPGPEWEPVISADHRVQLMDLGRQGKDLDDGWLALLIWSPMVNKQRVTIKVAGQPQGSSEPEPVTVPPEVRKELVALGYAHPPSQVVWARMPVQSYSTFVTTHEPVQVDCGGFTPPLSSVVPVEWTLYHQVLMPQAIQRTN